MKHLKRKTGRKPKRMFILCLGEMGWKIIDRTEVAKLPNFVKRAIKLEAFHQQNDCQLPTYTFTKDLAS